MIAVFAGSYEQYQDCLRQTGLSKKEAPWICRFEDAAGRNFTGIIRWGTWRNIPEPDKLYTYVMNVCART